MKKKYIKPYVETVRFDSTDNTAVLISGNYNNANLTYSKDNINTIDF